MDIEGTGEEEEEEVGGGLLGRCCVAASIRSRASVIFEWRTTGKGEEGERKEEELRGPSTVEKSPSSPSSTPSTVKSTALVETVTGGRERERGCGG